MAQVLLQSFVPAATSSALTRTLDVLRSSVMHNDDFLESKTKLEELRKLPSYSAPQISLPEDLQKTHLISSPYSDLANQLDLRDLDTPFRLFALALTAMHPIRSDYATAPYPISFNWPDVFSLLRSICQHAGFVWHEQAFYVVIFRSQLSAKADRDRLGELDQRSHEEACASGGLLKYWFGSPDAEGNNLATCLWRDHHDAVEGGKGSWHKQARAAARIMYSKIDFQIQRLVIEADVQTWRLEDVER